MNPSRPDNEEVTTRLPTGKRGVEKRKDAFLTRVIRLLFRSFLLGLLLGLLTFLILLNSSRHLVEYILSREFQRSVTISDLRIDVLGHITATDIRISNPPWAEERNWIIVDKLTGFVDVSRLFQRQFFFHRLRIVGVRFFLQILEDGTTNLPVDSQEGQDVSSSARMSLEKIMTLLQARRVRVERGSFRMLMPTEEIDLNVESIRIRADRQESVEPRYMTNISLGKARFQMADIVDVTASLTGEDIEVDTEGARLTGKELILTAGKQTIFRSHHGKLVNFPHPFLKFDVVSTVCLDDVQDSLMLPIDLRGITQLKGQFAGLADDLVVTARVTGMTPLHVHLFQIDQLLSDLRYEDGAVYFRNTDGQLYDGRVQGDAWLQFLDGLRFSLRSRIKQIDIGKVSAALDVRQPVGGQASADISLTGDGFEADLITGSMILSSLPRWKQGAAVYNTMTNQVVMEGDTTENASEHIEASVSLRNGHLTVHQVNGYVAKTQFNTHGFLTFGGEMGLTTDIDSGDSTELAMLIDLFITPPHSRQTVTEMPVIQPDVPRKVAQKKQTVRRDPVDKTLSDTRMDRIRRQNITTTYQSMKSMVTGPFSMRTTINGTYSRPQFDVQFDLRQATLLNIPCQHLSTHVIISPEKLTVDRLSATMEQMQAEISGHLDRNGLVRARQRFNQRKTFTLAELPKIIDMLPVFLIKASIISLDLQRLSEFFPELPPLGGNADLKLDVERAGSLRGNGSVLIRNLTIGDETVFLTSLTTHINDGMVCLDNVSLIFFDPDRGHAEISGHGELTFDGRYTCDVQTESLDSNLIEYLQEFSPSINGIVAGFIRGEGTLSDPRFLGRLSLFDLNFERSKLGMGSFLFSFESSVLRGELSLHEQHVMTTFSYNIATSRVERGEVRFTESDFLPVLSLVGLANVPNMVGRATGEILLEGSLLNLDELTVNATLTELIFGLESYQLTNTSTIQATLSGGILTLPPMYMTGMLSTIYLSGFVDIPQNRLEIGAEGQIDLSLLPSIEPEIKYSEGTAAFGAHIEGPFDTPYISLETFITNGSFSLTALPVEIERISATLSLKNRQIAMSSFQAFIGSGTINAEGNAYLPELNDTFDPLLTMLDISIDATSIELDYPEGFFGIVSAKLDVSNSLEQPFISGKTIVHSGDLEQQINIRALLIESIRDVLRSRPAIFLPPVAEGFNPGFNITIENEQPLKLLSDDVVASFNLDLFLSGRLSDPKLQGTITISEGEVYFDTRVLALTNSTISFLNPKGIYPSLDIIGESTIQRYRVQVAVSGEYPDILLSFSSDEGLTKNEVLSLILFGERDMSSGQVGKTESLRFASDIFLENEILNKVKQLFSISKFQVAPIWITEGGSSNVRMQMTVGAEIIGGYLTYTRSAETTDYDIITMEWELSRRLVIGFIRDKDRSYGGDLRFKFPFP